MLQLGLREIVGKNILVGITLFPHAVGTVLAEADAVAVAPQIKYQALGLGTDLEKSAGEIQHLAQLGAAVALAAQLYADNALARPPLQDGDIGEAA